MQTSSQSNNLQGKPMPSLNVKDNTCPYSWSQVTVDLELSLVEAPLAPWPIQLLTLSSLSLP